MAKTRKGNLPSTTILFMRMPLQRQSRLKFGNLQGFYVKSKHFPEPWPKLVYSEQSQALKIHNIRHSQKQHGHVIRQWVIQM